MTRGTHTVTQTHANSTTKRSQTCIPSFWEVMQRLGARFPKSKQLQRQRHGTVGIHLHVSAGCSTTHLSLNCSESMRSVLPNSACMLFCPALKNHCWAAALFSTVVVRSTIKQSNHMMPVDNVLVPIVSRFTTYSN